MLVRVALVAGWLTGCVAAPREVEVVLTPGPKDVAIEVTLHDVRGLATDELTRFETFGEFATWKPDWVHEFPWAPDPARFEFQPSDAGLSLRMSGTMPRAAFDGCAQVQADGGVRCEGFPLARVGASWVATSAVLKSVRLPEGQATRWAADAGVITFRAPIEAGSDQAVLDGPSLRSAFELWRRDPSKAAAALDAIHRAEARFVDPKAGAAWGAEVSDLAKCRGEPWCGLRREALRRKQLLLVWLLLTAGEEESQWPARPPPDAPWPGPSSLDRQVVSGERLSPTERGKVREAYDQTLERWRKTGQSSWARGAFETVCQRGHTPVHPSDWATVCARLTPSEAP
jgi:hypothetical protein